MSPQPSARTSQREGVLFVISAPSGAGKTSLCRQVIDFFPGLAHSVSYTTRAMRAGEAEGRDYHFVTPERFAAMVAAGAFAEWAEVHGNRYGTAIATLQQALQNGTDILLDIDFQGAAQLKRNFRQGVFIYVLPPSLPELERRLRGRNTDSPEVIDRRIANARSEMREASWYDYLVINDDFDIALDQLKSIIVAESCRTARRPGVLATVLDQD